MEDLPYWWVRAILVIKFMGKGGSCNVNPQFGWIAPVLYGFSDGNNGCAVAILRQNVRAASPVPSL
jgi:hypothetical protein